MQGPVSCVSEDALNSLVTYHATIWFPLLTPRSPTTLATLQKSSTVLAWETGRWHLLGCACLSASVCCSTPIALTLLSQGGGTVLSCLSGCSSLFQTEGTHLSLLSAQPETQGCTVSAKTPGENFNLHFLTICNSSACATGHPNSLPWVPSLVFSFRKFSLMVSTSPLENDRYFLLKACLVP